MRQRGSEYIPNGIPAHDVCTDNHKSKGTPQHLTIFDYIAYTVLLFWTTLPALQNISNIEHMTISIPRVRCHDGGKKSCTYLEASSFK